jgi:hypothetical protein
LVLKAKADQHAANILPEIEAIRAAGITGLKGIADELNRREIPTANGGKWYPTTVANLLKRNSAS